MKARPIWDNRHVSDARERALEAREELRRARDTAALVTAELPGGELVKFLNARLDELEAKAKVATPGPWEAVVDDHGRGEIDASVWADSIRYYVTEKISSGGRHVADAEHIALHDPVRVLAEVEAKRGTIRLYEDTLSTIETFKGHGVEARAHEVAAESYLNVIRLDAAVYSSHPEYNESWRP